MKIIREASIETRQWGSNISDHTIIQLPAVIEVYGISFSGPYPRTHDDVIAQNRAAHKIVTSAGDGTDSA
jgi:hypothetical protein